MNLHTRLGGIYSVWTAGKKFEIRQDSCTFFTCQTKYLRTKAHAPIKSEVPIRCRASTLVIPIAIWHTIIQLVQGTPMILETLVILISTQSVLLLQIPPQQKIMTHPLLRLSSWKNQERVFLPDKAKIRKNP